MLAVRRSRSIQYNREEMVIPASAIVDVISAAPAHGQGLGKYRVEVWGKEPNDYVRVYEIAAKSDNVAAREGLDRFSEEIGKLIKNRED